MLHQLYLSAKLNTVARLDAQANKKPKVSKVGATQYYHFLFCIGKRESCPIHNYTQIKVDSNAKGYRNGTENSIMNPDTPVI